MTTPLWKTILAATDFSAASDVSVSTAARLAHQCGARLLLLHIVELHGGLHETTLIQTPDTHELVSAGEFARTEATRQLLDQARRLVPEAVSMTPVVLIGHPAECIAAHAQELGAELIVVGTHGRKGLSRVLLGSVAERTVRLSPIPVLTIRTPDDAAGATTTTRLQPLDDEGAG
jgi:nucleotide-binding universal stress UspA family protein